MFKMLALAGLAALMTACAAPSSTATGEATAAQLGFHGPLDRSDKKTDGPN